MALHTPPPSGSLPGFIKMVEHPFRHLLSGHNISRAGTLDPNSTPSQDPGRQSALAHRGLDPGRAAPHRRAPAWVWLCPEEQTIKSALQTLKGCA